MMKDGASVAGSISRNRRSRHRPCATWAQWGAGGATWLAALPRSSNGRQHPLPHRTAQVGQGEGGAAFADEGS